MVVAAWKLPFVVAAIAVPVTLAFALAGPGFGVAVGGIVGVSVILAAALQRPSRQLAVAPVEGGRSRLLVVVSRPLEDAAAVRRVATLAGDGTVLVLAPARIGFLDRWASDVEGARSEAQRKLVISVASLAKAGIAAEARVGDADVVQAVEDQLRSFPATGVVLVTAEPLEDPAGQAAAEELAARLHGGFDHLALKAPPAP